MLVFLKLYSIYLVSKIMPELNNYMLAYTALPEQCGIPWTGA
jgi:hypothetical protein